MYIFSFFCGGCNFDTVYPLISKAVFSLKNISWASQPVLYCSRWHVVKPTHYGEARQQVEYDQQRTLISKSNTRFWQGSASFDMGLFRLWHALNSFTVYCFTFFTPFWIINLSTLKSHALSIFMRQQAYCERYILTRRPEGKCCHTSILTIAWRHHSYIDPMRKRGLAPSHSLRARCGFVSDTNAEAYDICVWL